MRGPAELDCFSHMRLLDGMRIFHIGDGSGHLENSMICPGRQAQSIDTFLEKTGGLPIERAILFD
jgi:hypothetical protein